MAMLLVPLLAVPVLDWRVERRRSLSLGESLASASR
jgi:hypothetical protein